VDLVLSGLEILEKYSVFAVIPVFWMLVKFFSNQLPRGGKDE
jgi:hypothetical protein